MDSGNSNNSSDDGSFFDFMSDLEGLALDLMKKTNKAPSDAWQSWMAFSSAINWKENWILSLNLFLFLLIIGMIARRRVSFYNSSVDNS
jgi:hypothetical protein